MQIGSIHKLSKSVIHNNELKPRIKQMFVRLIPILVPEYLACISKVFLKFSCSVFIINKIVNATTSTRNSIIHLMTLSLEPPQLIREPFIHMSDWVPLKRVSNCLKLKKNEDENMSSYCRISPNMS